MKASAIPSDTNSTIYWNILKNLSADVKLDLISKLSASLLKKSHAETAAGNWVDLFAGKWKDNRSAEEIIADIRNARTTNQELMQHTAED